MLETAPSVSAADLAVKSVRKASVRVVHRRSPVVRDYDGTPIMVRARPAVMSGYDGTLQVTRQYEAIPVVGAQPRYYLNGQPVLPNYPRSWPRAFRSRFS
jgi:hypothetical protein